MSDGSRCLGHCCKSFPLSASLEEVREAARAESRGELSRFQPGEAAKVAAMLLPLPLEGDVQRYTCRHLTVSGDCGNYEDRPALCRDYPYGEACQNPHCQWEDGRNPPIPAHRLYRGAGKLSACVGDIEAVIGSTKAVDSAAEL